MYRYHLDSNAILYLGNKTHIMSNDNNIDTLGNWLLTIGVIFIVIEFSVVLVISNIECWTLKDKYDYGIKALTTVGLIFGGIVGLINAFFAAQRAAAMEATAKAANEKQITERFAKAIEQLASEKIEVRLGAIYTLERIAKDSEKDQWTIMEVLTAFVRENAPIKKEEKSQNKKPLIDDFLNTQNKKEIEELPKLRLDIQECLTVIGRREHPDPPGKILNLSHVNISQANLRGAKLEGVNFKGAKLQGANLQEAKLQMANLEGAELIEANLQEAKLQMANLESAELIEAILDYAILDDANLKRANLKEAKLYSANLTRAILQGANLKEADLCKANLKEAILYQANLTGGNLNQADLTRAYLIGANLTKVYLIEAKFTEADLAGAILKGATMPDGSIHD